MSVNSSASCFLCTKDIVSVEYTTAVLEIQGIPDTPVEKANILKVICQLLRVRWDLMESQFSDAVSSNVRFPFCSGCFKLAIDIICVREKLFELESEIREKMRLMQTSVAENIDLARLDLYQLYDFDGKVEEPESYDCCRELFQIQVMTGNAVN